MKIDRQKIYEKYGGHCAYCGKKIEYKDMQIDHIIPKIRLGTNSIDNLNPACKLCNHYKRALSLEDFRSKWLGRILDRLHKIYIFRVALKYDLIELKPKKIKFYYEKQLGVIKCEK